MDFVVVKDFNYSHDGIVTERLKAGTTRSIRAELADGLVAAGLIQSIGEEDPREMPEKGAEMAVDEPVAEDEKVLTSEKRRPGRPPKGRL